VDRIIATARSIGIRNLSERLPITPSGDELQRLGETFNEMLERLESAVKRLKQFTADASHELRAPLSLTRTVAEVALRNNRLDEMSRGAFEEIVSESASAAVLLDQMLVLARADSEPYGIEMERVDLDAVVQESCAMATRMAAEKGLSVMLVRSEKPSVEILGNYSNLQRLVWILLDNALKYTAAPGEIRVSLDASGDAALLRVSDTGAGIDAVDLPYIFDRFYRADPSRSHVEGNGLGLSIAMWIVELHRGRISVESELERGTTFTVNFPLQAA
jgi:signal transduction histidine kinase